MINARARRSDISFDMTNHLGRRVHWLCENELTKIPRKSILKKIHFYVINARIRQGDISFDMTNHLGRCAL